MKKLLEFIVKSIVSSPEKVSITEEAPEAGLHRLTPATPLTALSEQTSHPGDQLTHKLRPVVLPVLG